MRSRNMIDWGWVGYVGVKTERSSFYSSFYRTELEHVPIVTPSSLI